MGQLASSLAHEINQPLGAILRNTEAAELFLQHDKPDLAELKAILADIRKDDQRAGGVIEKMRSLLKRQALELERVNVRELLDETVAIALPDARARHVRLILEAPPKLPGSAGTASICSRFFSISSSTPWTPWIIRPTASAQYLCAPCKQPIIRFRFP